MAEDSVNKEAREIVVRKVKANSYDVLLRRKGRERGLARVQYVGGPALRSGKKAGVYLNPVLGGMPGTTLLTKYEQLMSEDSRIKTSELALEVGQSFCRGGRTLVDETNAEIDDGTKAYDSAYPAEE